MFALYVPAPARVGGLAASLLSLGLGAMMPPTLHLRFPGNRTNLDQHDDALPISLVQHREVTQSNWPALENGIDRPSQRPSSHRTNCSLVAVNLDPQEPRRHSLGNHTLDALALFQKCDLQLQRGAGVSAWALIRAADVWMHILAVHVGIRTAGQLTAVAIRVSRHGPFKSITEPPPGVARGMAGVVPFE